jgi:plasmid stability protein
MSDLVCQARVPGFVDSNAIVDLVATLTIRRLDDSLKARLRVRAAHHGISMEEEARQILKAELQEEPKREENLAESIRRIMAPAGGVELAFPRREPVRRPPDFTN